MPKYIDNTAERLTSVKRASRDATLFRGFWQDDIAPLTTYDLVLDIPAGVDLFGFTRITSARTTTIHTTFFTVTSFVSAEGPFFGRTLDRRAGRAANSLAAIHRASSVSGELQHDPEAELYVATAGPVRAPSGQTETGAQPAFDSSELPMFRLENRDDTLTANVSLYIFWQELKKGVDG